MKEYKFVIGIDPGKHGALGLISMDRSVGYAEVLDLAQLDQVVKAIRSLNSETTLAVIEKVSASPRMGVTSAFHFGESFGVVQGIMIGLGFDTILSPPRNWKREMGLSSEKEASLSLARKVFPTMSERLKRKGDADRAEALLLAEWIRLSAEGAI